MPVWHDVLTVSRPIWIVSLAVVAGALVVGLTQVHPAKAPKATALTLGDMQAKLRGSPPALAALHAQGAQLLPTSKSAFHARLAALKGTPIVVNKWASWCGPCRFEFPYLQTTATQFGKRVAFLGLNSGDADQDARDFLSRFPVPYPSFIDPADHVAFSVAMPTGSPITEYYDAAGRRTFVHEGVYSSRAQLVADVRRYALQ
jgi:cytochrome c biogenesis protein CcmG/thiol:disulfide interchange protein DsbE